MRITHNVDKKLTEKQESFPTVREVQSEILGKLKDAAEQVNAKLIYADVVLSPRPVLWFCGTFEQVVAFKKVLTAEGLSWGWLKNKNKLRRFRPKAGGGYTGSIYRSYKKNSFIVHGVTSGVDIEFCAWSEERQSWQAYRALLESEASKGYIETLKNFKFLNVTLPVLGNCYEVWRRHPSRFKVDIVYTWVDGTDPDWRVRKAKIKHEDEVLNANTAVRFESGSELKYSVISALRYFVDLGDIYIVTDNQIPKILGDLLSFVKIIDHKDIFEDMSNLPTFNSHAIEAHLHNIPNLRRHYLYLNDDFLFCRPVAASNFFDELGRGYQFQSSAASIPFSKVGQLETGVDAAARNNQRLLRNKYDIYPYQKFKHAPVAIDREVMLKMHQDLPEAWENTVGNRFRSPQDHSISGHLYAHYAAFIGKSIVGNIRYSYFNLGEKNFKIEFKSLLKPDWGRVDTFCVNEDKITSLTASNRNYMDLIFQRIFPSNCGVRYSYRRFGLSKLLVMAFHSRLTRNVGGGIFRVLHRYIENLKCILRLRD